MYLWNLRSLTASLTEPPRPREQFAYLVGLFVIWGVPIPTTIALGSASYDDLAPEFAFLAIAIGGLRYAYGRNGGAGGRDFAVRLVAIAWVVAVRFAVVLTALALLAIYPGLSVAVGLASRFDIALEPPTGIADIALLCVAFAVQAMYWWVVGSQFGRIPAAA